MIELRGGLIVRDDAVDLALRLEAAGHRLTAKDGILNVSNGAMLADADRAAVKELKRHLLAIAGYDADAAEEVAPPLTTGVWSRVDDVGNSADDDLKEAAAPPISADPPAPAKAPRKRKPATDAGLGLFDG